ncbi:RDD family protein [Janthinobacterium fluminis]|uniref:RDD family protein n=1 Tax=Janthinobacterium fluminis TaxID=2987524 RepID=A0ABT5JZP9_9BURK|nr:RDD family protein [Janthinobacterium fluminis]MDC8758210.1 RDD family protein [Janthinobacterium fluminis]
MDNEREYVGFWARVWASIIDTVLLFALTTPLLMAIYGKEYATAEGAFLGPADFIISLILPAVAIILFWRARGSTPGKMAIRAEIVDAETGGAPSLPQYIGRYLAYYLSALPLCMGFIAVAFNPKKQGWHDRLAGTVVVRTRRPAAVRLDKR